MSDNKESYTHTPLYNSRIVDTYIKLLRKKYPFVNIDDLLFYAKMKPYEVADPGHWFTQEQIDLFHEKLVQLTKNENISREAGRYAASPEALGHIGHWIMSLLDPATAFTYMGQIIPQFTRSNIYKSRKIKSNKIEITVTPKEHVNEKKFQCENRIGYFESIIRMFKCTQPKIEHPECIFKGDKCCRYVISWKQPFFVFWKRIRNYLALFALCPLSVSLFLNASLTLKTFLPGLLTAFLLLEIVFLRKERNELRNTLLTLNDSSNELLEQSSLNYNNALLTSEIGETLAKQIDRSELLEKVVEILRERLDYDRGLILMPNQEGSRLEYTKGYGYSNQLYEIIKNTSFHLDKADSKGVFVLCYKERKPFLVNDINSIQSELSQRSLEFAKRLRANSFICCPITYEEKTYGVLAVDNVKSKRPLVERDVNLLDGIAHFVGISLHNIDLIESKQGQFESLLRVLAASIDARDSLTAGHSEKVTEYSIGICQELGMDQESQYLVRVAALLHDYGKIGVPDSILKKPGKLTQEEYEVVKTHAMISKQILEQISFEGLLTQVPRIAGCHHERLDGSGYPDGLAGNEIPWEAQIISVADFFEAITAKRHYRDPMPVDVAFDLLFEKSGVQFDPRIVKALVSYYQKAYGYDPCQEEGKPPENSLKSGKVIEETSRSEFQSIRPQQQITGVYEKRRG